MNEWRKEGQDKMTKTLNKIKMNAENTYLN